MTKRSPICLLYEKKGPDGFIAPGLAPHHLTSDGRVLTRDSSTGVKVAPWLPLLFRWFGVEFHEKLVEEGLDPNCENWIVIQPEWMDRCFETECFIDHFNTETIKLIRCGKIKLIIFYPNEGYDLRENMSFLPGLHRIIEKNRIPVKSVYLIYGDLNLKKSYSLWKRFEGAAFPDTTLTHLIGYPIFEAFTQMEYARRYSDGKVKELELVSPTESLRNSERQFHFLSFNGVPRDHRVLFISELKRLRLEKYGLTSFLGHYYRPDHTCISRLENFGFKGVKNFFARKHLSSYITNWTAMTLDLPSTLIPTDHLRLDSGLYSSTCFSIVTETVFEFGRGRILFVTEKSYKPIVNMHPFIILGPPGTLKFLKSMGYETYPEIFDESYDDELNGLKRLRMVRDEVKKLCRCPVSTVNKMYLSVWEKLLHNRSLFFTRNHKTGLEGLVDEIAKH